jgi:phenylpropionate dioxygenase-like ring-hydroxylating dioxygenase large terminal subunit
MNKTVKRQTPETWDRRGLPAWTYHSHSLFELERTELFLNHWQIAGHVSDIPGPGDWMTFDFLDERALVIRDREGVVRAFHNLCRHRGARLVAGEAGRCRSALVCPFHGWVYNTDGSLRGPSRPETFGEFDKSEFGLKPVEMEIWNGFIFLRFNPGPQPAVKALLAPFAADFAAYGAADFLPANEYAWTAKLPVNWKSVRDVDNEGYHVAMAHPALQDLYGRTYRDLTYTNGMSASYAEFGDHPGRLWSVRNYLKIAPVQEHLPPRLRRSWTYYGLFPNAVIAFTPESAQFYQDVPVSLGETELRGRLYRRPNETRETRVARYLARRIDRETGLEDQRLSIWSNESMRSSAFDEFHLSDLEFGVRNHHDQIRRILPVTRLRDAPPEGEVAARNNDLLRAEEISV